MKILTTGGGSGGHITPLLAVAAELKTLEPTTQIYYIGQHGDKVARGVGDNPSIDTTYAIFAGKLRRYHGEGWRQLLDLKTMFFNIRDMVYTAIGCMQALWIVGRVRPDAVFIKGGFVGVPVGLAAAFWHVPYITHDSDAIAGLANRIIARWATAHAVGLPESLYAYPKSKTKTVGVPITAHYTHLRAGQSAVYKKRIGLPEDALVVFVTGGGLGAKSLSDAMVAAAPALLARYPRLYIVHLTGYKTFDAVHDQYQQVLPPGYHDRLVLKDFVGDLYNYSGAADVVVTRAGATSIAELAMQGKACIIVPNPVLAGGHQTRNAEAYHTAGAALIVKESELKRLLGSTIASLLDDPTTRALLADKLHEYANPHASRDLAEMILAAIRNTGK